MKTMSFRPLPENDDPAVVALYGQYQPTVEDLAEIQEFHQEACRVANLNAFRSGNLDLSGEQTVRARPQ